MPDPPKKGAPDDLAEVERALSVLQGRHPEHERARREDEATRAKRKAELEAAAREEDKRVLAARLKTGAIAAGGALVLTVLGLVFRSEFARHGRIEEASVPYRSMGFVVVATSSRGSPGVLEATTDAGCLVAVSTGSTPMRVTHPAGSIEGPGPIVFCSCQGERVAVRSEVESGGGLALLRNDAAATGGSRAFAFLPFKPGTIGETDAACAGASLDAWLAAKRYPKPTPRDAWLAEAERAPLRDVGAAAVATLEADKPFAVVDVPAASCAVAVSSRASDQTSARVVGGDVIVGPSKGAVGWCASAASTVLVEREGDGEVDVVVVPAPRVGGLFGLREVAASAGAPLAAAAVPPSDRGWSAKLHLMASAVPEALISVANAPELPPDPEARLVAVAFGTPNALVAESPPETFSFCQPPLDERTTTSVCAFSGPQTWRIANADAVGGIARAKLPFWLFGLEGITEPAALKVETDLLSFARRLKKQGFEPTTLEAVTELPNGAEVLGRSGEDAVVALGLAAVAPWAFPFTDGDPWSIEGEPRVVPLATLQRVTLTTSDKKPLPKANRHTVVFRRQKK